MIKIYYLEIDEAFNILNYPNYVKLFSCDRLKKPSLYPDIKYNASLLGEIIVKQFAASSLNTKVEDLQLIKNKNGKPFLKEYPDFHFNISHSYKALVVAFSDTEVGIDIEKFKKPNFKIAKRFFNNAEYEYIKNHINPDYAFFTIWTAKEAYFKKLGKGIDADFKNISVLEKNIKSKIITTERSSYILSVCSENISDFQIIELDKI